MTTITLNLRETLFQELGSSTLDVPASVDLDDLFGFNDLDEARLDLADLLSENRIIGRFWSVPDVTTLRPDLTSDQAWQVLQATEADLQARGFLAPADLRARADALFPPPLSNADRAARAATVIASHGDDLPESNLIDLLTDAMHWCHRNGQAFERTLRLATEHFEAESHQEGGA